MANIFNGTYVKVGRELAQNIKKQNNYFKEEVVVNSMFLEIESLKCLASNISEPLAYIFNMSMETEFKHSVIIPLYKSVINYLPVSLKNNFSKVNEKLLRWDYQNILKIITYYLISNLGLSRKQVPSSLF